MRTMLRLESYDVVTLNDSLKYSLLAGVRGKYGRFYRQTSGFNPLLKYMATVFKPLPFAH